MKRNWFLQMEQITIFMGVSIVLLGTLNILGEANISAALVTGISLAGLCLTISDFLSKSIEDKNNPKSEKKALVICGLLYYTAAFCIIAFPNSKMITSLSKDTLDSLSTSASVIALGFVFMMIGNNNRRAVINEQKKRNARVEDMEKALDENLIVIDEIKKIIAEQEETIKNLENNIKEMERSKSLISQSLSDGKQD
ncbi:hypothetical protein [Bacillus sp. AR8-1]|uniref:hypothetical protein n=1 Tax=Bacillus sp. AR8-1 TaxID=2217826 RepID=UPI002105B453|nr:hypothetical protein [Bacillus sp. AR8-1]